MSPIPLGSTVRDLVSGYSGIAVAATCYINGRLIIAIQGGVDKDGKVPDLQWFDKDQLQVLLERYGYPEPLIAPVATV